VTDAHTAPFSSGANVPELNLLLHSVLARVGVDM
jgi:hypothetical protein